MDADLDAGADDSSKPAIATRSRASLVDVDLSFASLDATAPAYPGLRACDRCRDRKGDLSSAPRLFFGAIAPELRKGEVCYTFPGPLRGHKQTRARQTEGGGVLLPQKTHLQPASRRVTDHPRLLQNSPLRPQKSPLHDLHEAERNLHHDPVVASPTRRQTLDRSRPRPRGVVPFSFCRGCCFGDSTTTTDFVVVWASTTGEEK